MQEEQASKWALQMMPQNYYQMAIDLNKLTDELDEDDIRSRLHSLFEI